MKEKLAKFLKKLSQCQPLTKGHAFRVSCLVDERTDGPEHTLGLGLIPERRPDLAMQESQHEELQAPWKLLAGPTAIIVTLIPHAEQSEHLLESQPGTQPYQRRTNDNSIVYGNHSIHASLI